jgi:hypothetical protein
VVNADGVEATKVIGEAAMTLLQASWRAQIMRLARTLHTKSDRSGQSVLEANNRRVPHSADKKRRMKAPSRLPRSNRRVGPFLQKEATRKTPRSVDKKQPEREDAM